MGIRDRNVLALIKLNWTHTLGGGVPCLTFNPLYKVMQLLFPMWRVIYVLLILLNESINLNPKGWRRLMFKED